MTGTTELSWPYKRPSLLTPETERMLQSLGDGLRVGRIDQDLVTQLVISMAELPARKIARLDFEIAAAGRLVTWRNPPPRRSYWRYSASAKPRADRLRRLMVWLFGGHEQGLSSAEVLQTTAQLEWIVLFHRNGYLREAALAKIAGPVPFAFFLSALFWRLNDWVLQVRLAAADAIERCSQETNADVIAQSLLDLIAVSQSWQRWLENGHLLSDLLARDAVVNEVATILCNANTGPLPSLLRICVQTPYLDAYLPTIAHSAVQPGVRALAFDALINGEARWTSHREWQWVDKPNGIRRRVPVIAKRAIAAVSGSEREDFIEMALADTSAAVRRRAMDAIIQHIPETDFAVERAHEHRCDPAPSVRERAQWLLDKNSASGAKMD